MSTMYELVRDVRRGAPALREAEILDRARLGAPRPLPRRRARAPRHGGVGAGAKILGPSPPNLL